MLSKTDDMNLYAYTSQRNIPQPSSFYVLNQQNLTQSDKIVEIQPSHKQQQTTNIKHIAVLHTPSSSLVNHCCVPSPFEITMFAKALLALGALAGIVHAELNVNRVVFSEILFRPVGGDRGQFIELYNPTSQHVNAGDYKVCNPSGDCTVLAGDFADHSYYVLCRDLSSYMFCRQATSLQLGDITQLFLYKSTSTSPVDVVTTPSASPIGESFTRGMNTNNLLEFSYTTPSPGAGYLGGSTVTDAPTPAPFAVAGVSTQCTLDHGFNHCTVLYCTVL